jgi:hypothetical protein
MSNSDDTDRVAREAAKTKRDLEALQKRLKEAKAKSQALQKKKHSANQEMA